MRILACLAALLSLLVWFLLQQGGSGSQPSVLPATLEQPASVEQPNARPDLGGSEGQDRKVSEERLSLDVHLSPTSNQGGTGALTVSLVAGFPTRPVVGASIAWAESQGSASMESDGEGRAVLAFPAGSGPHALAIEHPEYVDRRTLIPTGLEELSLQLEPSCHIEGEVLGWTQPGRVVLWPGDGDDIPEEDPLEAAVEQGRFAFADLKSGEYCAAFLAEGAPMDLRAGLYLEPGQKNYLSFGPLESQTLALRVVRRGTNPSPIEGAKVVFEPRRDGLARHFEQFALREATTDRDGRVRLEGLASGAGWVEATTSWGARVTRNVDLSSLDWGAEELTLQVPAPGLLQGSVRSSDGRAVSGARVVLFEVPEKRERFGFDRVVVETRSDEQGLFAFDQVPSTRPLMLSAARDGEAPSFAWRSGRTVSPGLSRSDFNVVLVEKGKVEGRVLDVASGQPLAGVEVRFELPIAKAYYAWRTVLSDSEGRVRLDDAPAGRLRAYTVAGAHSQTAEGLDVVGGGLASFTWELESLASLECELVDESGWAVEGGYAVARWAGAEKGPGRRVSLASDAFGRTRVEALQPGPWAIYPRATGWSEASEQRLQVEVPAAGPVRLVLQPAPRPEPVTLRGEVARKGDGAAIPGLRVSGERSGLLRVDGTRFEVSGARPGRIKLSVKADGYTQHTYAPFDALPGSEVNLERVELRSASEVELRLFMGKLELKGAHVTLRPPNAKKSQSGAKTWRLHEREGRYRGAHIPRGTYEMRVRMGRRRWKETLELKGRKVRRKIELEPK